MARAPRKRSSRRRGRWPLLLGMGLALTLAAAAFLGLYAESTLSQLVLGGLGESFSTRLYASPYPLQDGSAASPARLLERLKRLGYQRVTGQPAHPGEYSWEMPRLAIWLRGFKSPAQSQHPGLFALNYEAQRWQAPAPGVGAWLEPELAAELSGARKVRRAPATCEEIPDALKQAVIAAEDKRFYSHWGLDWRAIARALWSNLTSRGVMQGGSTITQQLSKNIFLSPKRNLRRKLTEAGLALYLELRYSKDRILTLYLNHIYLGQEGPVSVAGVKAAARFYFSKDLSELSTAECATIAGLIRSPYRYNPLRRPGESKKRRDFVLARMREEGFLSGGALARERAAPLTVSRSKAQPSRTHDNDYFVAEVLRQLLPRFGEETLFRHGLCVYTTLDPLLQRDAQRAVSAARPQAALVALDPRNGEVRALSGGRDFSESQFNRATQARRQPGSGFKPFVYGAALEKGFTAATLLDDAPRQYPRGEGRHWDPRNYGEIYFATTTLRMALAHSLNAATLQLAERVGIHPVVDFARRMGIESPLAADLGTALGASEVTLFEIVAAYAPFANGGWRWDPRLVVSVTDADGGVLEFDPPKREPVLEPVLSFLMTSLLQSVVREGTARALATGGWTRPAAGKTGTTNDGRDAWFIGYTPGLLAGAWVGDDQHKAIKATGAKDALPVWAAFMKAAAQDEPADDFPRPEGLVEATIDPASGLRALAGCPQRVTELFKEGTQPAEDCPLHKSGVKGFFQRLFRRGR